MTLQKQLIYLDNNATTPIDKRVLAEMMPFFTTDFGNANSTHQFGITAHEAVKEARNRVADLIGAEAHEIVFTSGSTEGINIALKGVAESSLDKGKHIITVSTEHSAVLDTCKYLETKGYEVTYLSVLSDGIIDLNELRSVIREDTILISVMLANNETGVLQPIQEIANLAHAAGAIFFCDATQAIGKIPINVDVLGIDILCISAHKLYAPKGVGALYVRQKGMRVRLPALLHGGGHERGIRSGTLNVPGIVGLGAACALAQKEMKQNIDSITNLRDYLENNLLKIEGSFINGNRENRLYNTINICFKGADSDAIIMGLSNPENSAPLVAVSNGSACTSASIEPSHVLIAMGLEEATAFNCVRFSLGKFNTLAEMDIVIDLVNIVVNQLLELSK